MPNNFTSSATAPYHRWVVLSQYYPPEIGAPQIRLRCFVRELRKRGKDVSVWTAMPSYPAGRIFAPYKHKLYCKDEVDGVSVHRVWAYPATGRSTVARLLNYSCFAFMVLPFLLMGRRPDLIFVEAQPLPLGLVALAMKAIRGVPYVYNVPDLQVDVARQLGFLRLPILLRLAEHMESMLLRHAWKVATVTHGFMEHFERKGIPGDRITFLPNGADTDFLQPSTPNTTYLSEWQLKDKLAFVYVGTHAYYHGLDTLVEAAERLQYDSRITFVLVGDGPERARIRNLVINKGLDNVLFARVPYEGTKDLYSVAYASIATLRNLPVAEGMRLSKVFPSLSCGVPVIYSGSGEAANMLAQEHCGLVVPPEQPEALAAAIKELAEHMELRNELGRNGRRYVEHTYSWSTIVTQWLNSLEPSPLLSSLDTDATPLSRTA